MLKQGDEERLYIIETNIFGNGVAKIDDVVVFCRGAVCGDEVDALITDVKRNYAEAKCLNIVKPSEHRRALICPYAADCGGCVFDGVSLEHEREVKRRAIEAAFRLEKQRVEVSRFFSGADHGAWCYRRRHSVDPVSDLPFCMKRQILFLWIPICWNLQNYKHTLPYL